MPRLITFSATPAKGSHETRTLRFFVLAVCAACAPSLDAINTLSVDDYIYAAEPSPEAAHPAEIAREYTHNGRTQHYLVQEPEKIADDAPVLVFVHGADSDEGLGMGHDWGKGTFTDLRNAMAERDWIYISIRNYEFEGLREDIAKHYGDRLLILAANSAGGAATLREVTKNPEHYDGLILSCPALNSLDNQAALEMPIILSVGEDDRLIARFCRRLAAELSSFNETFGYVEIPDAGHAEPLLQANWGAQADFVYEAVR